MALKPLAPGLKVEIVQGSDFDQPLKEYRSSDTAITPSPPLRFVQATSGGSFGVRFEVPAACFGPIERGATRPNDYISAVLIIDGELIVGHISRLPAGRSSWKYTITDQELHDNGIDVIPHGFRFKPYLTENIDVLKDPSDVGHVSGNITMLFRRVTHLLPSSLGQGYSATPDQPTPPEEVSNDMYDPPNATWWLPGDIIRDDDHICFCELVRHEYRCLDKLKTTELHPQDKADIQNEGEGCDCKRAVKEWKDFKNAVEKEDVKNAVEEEEDVKNPTEEEEDVKNALKQEQDTSHAPVRSTTPDPGIKKETHPTDVKMEEMGSTSEQQAKSELIDQDVVMKVEEDEDEVAFVSSKPVRKRKKGKRG